jgi:ATP-binding protein involved in chromosome partitioning
MVQSDKASGGDYDFKPRMMVAPRMPKVEDVLKVLSEVKDPELGRDVVSLHMIEGVRVDGGRVEFTLNLTTPACPLRTRLEEAARGSVAAIPGVEEVVMKTASNVVATREYASADLLRGVKNVIAVASGKGGVGKSTVAVNLAVALASSGAKVGILDADVYGPNIPLMMGVSSPPVVQGERIIPPVAQGVKVASLGFFYNEATPVIWRGPLVAGAVRQLLTQVEWGDLDYLVCDLPPGTGDASLTLAQTVPLGGIVVVTTPQEAALNIAAKALAMFKRLDIHILGVVENMSYFVCPHCGERTDIFSAGGGRKIAAAWEADFLGEIPFGVAIREQSDVGLPIVAARPDSPEATVYKELAFKVAGLLSIEGWAKTRK